MKFIHELLDCYFDTISTIARRYIDKIYKDSLKIEEVSHYLSDFQSKDLYKKEIIFLLMRSFLNKNKACYFSGLMTDDEYELYKSIAKSNNYLPNYISVSREKDIIDFMTNTFYLEQYKYKDIVKIENNDICIDCGAHCGDSTIYMIKEKAQHVFSFEIDNDLCNIAKKNLATSSLNEKASIINAAISNISGDAFFIPAALNSSGSGQIVHNNIKDSVKIKSYSIDDFCTINNIEPNFIKMNIEGSEINAIKGGESIIKKYKPKLAISIYHSWNDRIEIPLLLHDLVPEYKMYLKKCHPIYETILFCSI